MIAQGNPVNVTHSPYCEQVLTRYPVRCCEKLAMMLSSLRRIGMHVHAEAAQRMNIQIIFQATLARYLFE